MFSATERTAIRAELITLATEDPRIAGAALAGSAARGTEDAWSDIDLLLQLDSAADEPTVVDDWSDTIDTRFGVADTLDVFAVGVRYRVFLLRSSLQIDVSFWRTISSVPLNRRSTCSSARRIPRQPPRR